MGQRTLTTLRHKVTVPRMTESPSLSASCARLSPVAVAVRIMKRRHLTAIAVTLALAAAGSVLRDHSSPRDEVQRGELSFTRRLGWVNWRHAKDDGVRTLWKHINTQLDTAEQFPVALTYRQSMGGGYGPLWISTSVERRYEVRRPLSKKERKAVAWHLLKETSASFETLQGSWPNALDQAARNSTFRAGDLAGNWVAYQTAIEDRTRAEIIATLGCETPDETLRRLERNGTPGKSHTWPAEPEPPDTGVELDFKSETQKSWRVGWRR
jgi:hypothetical protein